MASVQAIDSLCGAVHTLLVSLEKAKGNVYTIRRGDLGRKLWRKLLSALGDELFETVYMTVDGGYVVYTKQFRELLTKFASEHCYGHK